MRSCTCLSFRQVNFIGKKLADQRNFGEFPDKLNYRKQFLTLGWRLHLPRSKVSLYLSWWWGAGVVFGGDSGQKITAKKPVHAVLQ